jgi:hypothetical protein
VQTSAVNECAIIGGGAAGLATAIFTARRNPEWRITIVDGAKRLGAKILISGGGRCNVTNDVVTPEDFWGGSRHVIRRVLGAFSAARTVEFFRELGVALHVEPGGKLFPNTNRARTILDALLREADRLGVQILTGHRVTEIERRENQFYLTTPERVLCARRAVLATGGLSVAKTGSDGTGYRLARSLGHSLIPQTPALVGLVLDGKFHAELSGISHDAELIVRAEGAKPLRFRGPLLWTHFGVSGPIVLNASRHWHQAQLIECPVVVSINMLPGEDFESADRRLVELARGEPRVALHNGLARLLPARVATAVLERINMVAQQPMGQVSREDRRTLAQSLVELPILVRASRGYPYAEVTAGGVPLDEVHPSTMESRQCPGLFLVGEILDVDGRIGGFNFQWAWSSAWVAADGMSACVSEQ